ncbi:hypothetical protein [Roseivirga pacifica]|uniref:hypothetical protein n=1 Tax=Roseivirga pacifica TaxID=1267423 RepID=UPI002094A556|nr:hypothetical protein [Roseivirga pacifica]MCO6358191.1 hypothetical protein [Roseivirga pacifica]MCO6366629.1 hypothetical protein [Roseivirga pacifica]MCO6371114.1 hypothetical protein [Roseivirga pacifica]MCO6373922.1 hypothetical protein [Roseivirga pacifica]MCO6380903.1 hypothetical protein [Roseivirga pacifica]
MNLTIEHLAPRLPYGLKLQNKFGEIGTLNGVYNEGEEPISMFDVVKGASGKLEDVKPILRPLSIIHSFINHTGSWRSIAASCEGRYIVDAQYDESAGVVLSVEDGNGCSLQPSIDDYKVLYKLHLDTDGLIEAGLAIDVSTLDVNPYAQ